MCISTVCFYIYSRSEDLPQRRIWSCLMSPASKHKRFPQQCAPRTLEAAGRLRLSVYRTSKMYLWHLGFWRKTFPLLVYKSTLVSPQI